MSHEVNLEVFEGPVELLLYLVRKNEIDVLDVPITQLTDGFLDHVRSAKSLNLESAADFLVMAGVLLRLKIRQLLPSPKEEDLETPTVTLEQILDEFRKYQQAARVLSGREEERRLVFPRSGVLPRGRPGQEDLALLTAAFRRLLERIRPESVVEVAPRKVRFEDKLRELRQLVRTRGTVDFEEAIGSETLAELIVMFIAVLELVRLGEIRAEQQEQFGTITLRYCAQSPTP